MLAANATLNSYRFPYGPRPTTIPRSTSDADQQREGGERDAGRGPRERGGGGGEPDGAVAAAARERHEGARHAAGRERGPADGREGDDPPPVGEQHGMTDVRREAEGGRDHAEDEEQRGGLCHVVSRDAGGPAGWFRGAVGSPAAGRRARRAAQAAARPPGGGPAGRRERVVGVRVNERPQLPQVSSVAGRTSEHLGQATTRGSPDGERVLPGS